MQAEKSLHVAVFGDSGAGHSALLRCYRGGGGAPPRGSLESLAAAADIGGEAFRVRFTDNVGKGGSVCLRHIVLRSSHAVLLCFAVDTPETFASLEERWFEILRESGTEAPVFLIGLRADKRGTLSAAECVEEGQARELARRHGAFGYRECSSLFEETVQQVMDDALLAAKAYYSLQWQLDVERETAGGEVPYPDDEHEAAPWLEHERLNDPEDTAPLRVDTLKQSLSMLGSTLTRQHAYLRCDLPGLELTTINELRSYQHLQFINVSGNRLRDLEPLGALRSLLHLNASFNLLIRTQCFTAPDALETLDMSYNMIGDLGEWGVHRYLRELNLRGNLLAKIGPGLTRSWELRMLDLSENHLAQIENMEGLHLRTLLVAQNRLSSLEGVGSLNQLQVLNVRHNNITSVSALRSVDVPRLRRLCVSDNRISRICEVEGLESFAFLCDLLLGPNPVVDLPHYRSQVLHRLPRLRSLDSEGVTAEEKVKADIIYGADVETRRQIFEDLLPEETFVDRRLMTAEGIVELEEGEFGACGDAGPYGRLGEDGGARFSVEDGEPEDVGFFPQRTRFQEAKFRQRLVIARSGGEPRGHADFAKFPAPFLRFMACDSDVAEILEACEEGQVESLDLSGAKLSVAGVQDVVAALRQASKLRHVFLSGCASVGAIGSELIRNFPFDRGCSLEANDCGLDAADAEKLRSHAA